MLGHYEEAVELGRANDVAQVFLRASLHRLLLLGVDSGSEVETAVARAAELNWGARIELVWMLWRATGDPAHRDEARRLLVHLREHAPPEHREGMVQRSPLYAEILESAPRAV